MRKTILSLLGCLLMAAPALAQDKEPAGVLSLDASASVQVANDTAVMAVFVERQAVDAARAADGVARVLDEAARQARAVAGVEVRTGGVTTFPSYDRDGKIAGWRSRGELILESRDFGQLAALGARLNPQMQIAGVHFKLSREARSREEARLIDQAAEAFRQKAAQAAKAFGYSRYTIREVSVSSGERPDVPPVPYRAKALGAQMESAPVPLEGGRAEVVITVSGSVQMER
ncbi:MAG: SIMPL domain-containing protein [Pseudomonadota bacterium]